MPPHGRNCEPTTADYNIDRFISSISGPMSTIVHYLRDVKLLFFCAIRDECHET